MSDSAHVHHGIDYVELSVTSMEDAQRFYGAAFGWNFTDYGPGYAGIQKVQGEGESGGMCVVPEVSTGGPLIILYSANLDETFEQVKSAGGKIAKEPFPFPGGRRFHFLDPSGNELAVWGEAGGRPL